MIMRIRFRLFAMATASMLGVFSISCVAEAGRRCVYYRSSCCCCCERHPSTTRESAEPKREVLPKGSADSQAATKGNSLDGRTPKSLPVLKTTPGTSTSESKLAAVEHNRKGLEAYAQGKFEIAFDEFSHAVRLDRDHPKAFYNRAVVFMIQGKHVQAVDDFTSAIANLKTNANAYKLRGMVTLKHLKNPDYSKALSDFENAVRINPEDAQSHSYLAFLLSTCNDAKLRNGRRAVHHAIEACKLSDWKNSEQILVLSAANAEAGQYDLAVERAKQAVELAPVEQKDNCRTVLMHFQQQAKH